MRRLFGLNIYACGKGEEKKRRNEVICGKFNGCLRLFISQVHAEENTDVT